MRFPQQGSPLKVLALEIRLELLFLLFFQIFAPFPRVAIVEKLFKASSYSAAVGLVERRGALRAARLLSWCEHGPSSPVMERTPCASASEDFSFT